MGKIFSIHTEAVNENNDSSEDEGRYLNDFVNIITFSDIENNEMQPINEEQEYIQPHFEKIKINDKILEMEVGTGANISAISEACYKRIFLNYRFIYQRKCSIRTIEQQCQLEDTCE